MDFNGRGSFEPLRCRSRGVVFPDRVACVAAYLEDAQKEGPFNVVGVDWGALCASPLYVSARMHVWGVGQRVGELLNFLVDNGLGSLDRMHLIGHSLGAHVAGIAAKMVDSGKVYRITGAYVV